MSQLLGKFTVWGTPGTATFTGLAAADIKVKGVELSDNVSVADARDGAGYIFGSSVRRDTHVLTLTLIPFDSSSPSLLATAKSNVKLPAEGAVITIGSFGATVIDGDWNYIGGARIVYADDDQQTVTIQGVQCRRVAASGSAPAVQTVL